MFTKIVIWGAVVFFLGSVGSFLWGIIIIKPNPVDNYITATTTSPIKLTSHVQIILKEDVYYHIQIPAKCSTGLKKPSIFIDGVGSNNLDIEAMCKTNTEI